MAAVIDHLGIGRQEAILHYVFVEFGAGVRVGDGDLNGFDIEFFGERNGVLDGLVSLAGKAKDEISVNDQAEFVAVLGELASALYGGAFLYVLENLWIARFVSDDEEAATRFLHGFQSFVVGGHARGTRPGQA